MSDTIPINIKTSVSLNSDTLFLSYCKKYIEFYYPNKSKAVKPIINAFDRRENKLFKILNPVSSEQLINSIKDDLTKLNKLKIRFHQIMYFSYYPLLSNEYFIQHIKKTLPCKNNSYDFISFPVLITALSSTNINIDPQLFINHDLQEVYSRTFIKPERTLNIIEEIFDYVFSSQVEIKYATSIKEGLEKLLPKISINFAANDRDSIQVSYSDNWYTKTLVDQYIRNKISLKPLQIFAMLSKVHNEYRKLNPERDIHYPVNYFSNVITISKSLIPLTKHKIPEYHACCLSIVLYFFEMCDIGDRTKNEQLSFIEQFKLDGK